MVASQSDQFRRNPTMNGTRGFRMERAVACAALFAVTVFAAAPEDGQPGRRVLGHGVVTSDDVYVRSGPSMNHYPVCKLAAGVQVTVVGETGEWLEILPPVGVFSFVSGDYVDSADGKSGVINGENVRVRAGSTLDDFAHLKYVVQSHVSKGAAVEILSRDPDGFLRIKSPAGVTVWVSRTLVDLLPDAALGATDSSPPGGAAGASAGARTDGGEAGQPQSGDPTPILNDNALAHVDAEDVRTTLAKLDEQTAAEIDKPVLERSFETLIVGYGKVAEQQEDAVAREYAEARVRQLTDMSELVTTVQTMRRLNDDAAAKRRAYLERRAKIGEANPPIPVALDARGELRESAVYSEGLGLQRYRLVDTAGDQERTIAYVEVPAGTNIDAHSFLGQYVGVRAVTRRLLGGGVDAVPIFVVGEIVRLDREKTGNDRQG